MIHLNMIHDVSRFLNIYRFPKLTPTPVLHYISYSEQTINILVHCNSYMMPKERKGIFGGASTSSHGVVDHMLKRQLAKDGHKVEAFFSKSTTRQDVFNVDTLVLIFKRV
jgi:hypothetical protein